MSNSGKYLIINIILILAIIFIQIGNVNAGTTIQSVAIQTLISGAADVNGDGGTNIVDALFKAQYTAGSRTLTGAVPLISPVSTNPDHVSVGNVTLTPGSTGTVAIKVDSVTTDIAAATGVATGTNGVVTIIGPSNLQTKIWSEDKYPATPYIWNSYNFEGFYYDIKYDRSSEVMTLLTAPATLSADRTIQKNQLVYRTHVTPVQFKANEKEGVTVDGDATFALEGWQAEKWIAVKSVSNKIAKLTFEMGKEDKKTLTTGETWALGSGYELTINAIDLNTTPRQVWLTLKKDGTVIDQGIGQAPIDNSLTEKSKAIYFKKKTILGESDALLFTVYISNIFSGATSSMVQFKYAWLIDESSAKEVHSADRYGVFEVRTASDAQIMMDNENTISLSKNTETTIMGNMKFLISDNDTLRFYPFVTLPTSGIYEVRGTVVQESTPGLPSWDAYNFAGFFYDLKYDRTTEQLSLQDTVGALKSDRTIQKNRLVYTTHDIPVQFKANEKEGVTVDGDATFALEGWQAEKWIAVKGVSNKIAKLAFEMGKEDKKTLTTGEIWALGAGYELIIGTIDASTIPREVGFTLKKDGAVIDQGIGQAPIDNSLAEKSKAVYFKKKNILGESDALLFTVYVSNIFSGATSNMVQFKYAWLIDESSAKEVQSADRYGVFEVRTTAPIIMMDNENVISLSKNSETTLMGNMKFVIADNDTLRFYPKIDSGISETPVVTPTAQVSVSNTTAATGSNATVAIKVLNAFDLSAATLTLSYDPAVVQIVGISEGDLGSPITVINNVAGTAAISVFSTSPVNGTVTYANIKFNVIGVIGSISPLALSVEKFADSNGAAINYTVSGSTLTVSDVQKGDVNNDGNVDIVDALFIAQYTVGKRTLTVQQLAAADVNGDGQVTVVDALFIAQYTVGARIL